MAYLIAPDEGRMPVATKTKKAKKTVKKAVAKKVSRPARRATAIGGAFEVLAGKKPDPDGPWKPGEGWGQSTGPNPFSQWLKARKPK